MINRIAWAIDARESKIRLLPKYLFPGAGDSAAASAVTVALFASKAAAKRDFEAVNGPKLYPRFRIIPVRFKVEFAERSYRRPKLPPTKQRDTI